MVGILPSGGAVVLADLIVSPEHDGFRLRRNVGAANRPAFTDDPDLRDVLRLIHADQISAGRRCGVTSVRLVPSWTRFLLPSPQDRSQPTASSGGTASNGCSWRRRVSLPFQRSSG